MDEKHSRLKTRSSSDVIFSNHGPWELWSALL